MRAGRDYVHPDWLMQELKRGGEERFPAPEGTTEEAWRAVVWKHYLRWSYLCFRGGYVDTKNACRKAYIHTGGEVDKFVLYCAEFPPLLQKPASKAKATIEAWLGAMFNDAVTPQDNNDGTVSSSTGFDRDNMTSALFHDEVYSISYKEAWGF